MPEPETGPRTLNRLLRPPQAMAYCGLRATEWYGYIATDPTFPKAIRLSGHPEGHPKYDRLDLDIWIDAKKATSLDEARKRDALVELARSAVEGPARKVA